MKVGDTVSVVPAWINGMPAWYQRSEKTTMEAKIIYINTKHLFCVVEYPHGQREGFKIWCDKLKANSMKPDAGRHWESTLVRA